LTGGRFDVLGGYQPLVAGDGEEGIRMAAAERPDLILMDLDLPVVDGWEAARQLKANLSARDIPITALSAHAGCDEFDTRPIDFDRLLSRITRLLNG
jgi:CheY-like chemotaxis protein